MAGFVPAISLSVIKRLTRVEMTTPKDVDVVALADQQLKALIDNHRQKAATDRAVYINALAEHARRTGHGLDFDKSFDVIRRAAAESRFVSYKELADASGANWNRVHYSIGHHLWSLVEYAHRKGWPMLSAIVVNKDNVDTGDRDVKGIPRRRPATRVFHSRRTSVSPRAAAARLRMGGSTRVAEFTLPDYHP